MFTRKQVDLLTYKTLGCAIEVHKNLGPGLLESVYERCFLQELAIAKLSFKAQQKVPITYKGCSLSAELRYDVLVEDTLIVELKSVEAILPVHESILLTYMKLLEKPKGLLINFNCTNLFYTGQKTFVNEFYASLRKT